MPGAFCVLCVLEVGRASLTAAAPFPSRHSQKFVEIWQSSLEIRARVARGGSTRPTDRGDNPGRYGTVSVTLYTLRRPLRTTH